MTKRQVGDLAFLALLGALAVYVVTTAQRWPFGSRLFPTVVGLLMLGLLLAQLAVTVRAILRQRGRPETPIWRGVDPRVAARRATTTVLSIIGIAAAVWLLGFPLGGPLAVALQLRFVAREGAVPTVAITLGAVAMLWAMSQLLRIPFPDPALPFLSNPF